MGRTGLPLSLTAFRIGRGRRAGFIRALVFRFGFFAFFTPRSRAAFPITHCKTNLCDKSTAGRKKLPERARVSHCGADCLRLDRACIYLAF